MTFFIYLFKKHSIQYKIVLYTVNMLNPVSDSDKNLFWIAIFLIWWLQMAFIAIFYMYIDIFALQHTADRPGEYRTYDAHQSVHFNLSVFLHRDVSLGHLREDSIVWAPAGGRVYRSDIASILARSGLSIKLQILRHPLPGFKLRTVFSVWERADTLTHSATVPLYC